MSTFNGDSPVVISRDLMQGRLSTNYTTCERYVDHPIHWKGVWSGEDPTEYVFSLFMLQIILSFLISRSLYFVLRPLKQAKFVCDVLTGIILGPSVLGRGKESLLCPARNRVLTNTVSAVGGIYFMFLTSVKMDKSRVLLNMKKVGFVSLACMVVPFIITTTLFLNQQKHLSGLIQGSSRVVILISACFALSNYPVVTHALNELNLLNSELGHLATSAVVLHEIIARTIVSLVALIGPKKGAVIGQLCTHGLIVFVVFVLRPLVKWIIRTTPEGKPVKGVYIKLILLAPLITGMLSDTAGSTYFVGAQVMGLIIPAGPPLGSAVAEKIELILSEFLMPFFFIQVGQVTNVHLIQDWKAFIILQFVLVAGYLGRIAGSSLTLLCCNTGMRNTILLSFILNIQGVIQFHVFLWWRLNKFVDEAGFTAIVLSSCTVAAVMIPLIQIFHKPEKSLKVCSTVEICLRTIQSMPFDNQLGVLCCIHCEDNVKGMIKLLKAFNSIESSPIRAYALHLSSLTGRSMPLFAPYKNEWRTKTNSIDRIMSALSKHLISSSVPITIEPWMMIAPYKTMHERICKLVKDELIPFIIVPFPESLELYENKADLRGFNMNILKYALNTVGILVDRSAYCTNDSSYNVLVLFIGGLDDREALALALRMSSHPKVSITMIRIEFKVDKEHDETERCLDDFSINDFKTKNTGNARVMCKEVVVEKTMQGIEAIRSIDNKYDLVIVGKQQGNSQLEEEMLPWIEYKELGIIGDLVASSDFCEGTTSVLVMHCAFGNSTTRISGGATDYSWNTSNKRSDFSFSSSNCDKDDDDDVKAFVANREKSVKVCTQI